MGIGDACEARRRWMAGQIWSPLLEGEGGIIDVTIDALPFKPNIAAPGYTHGCCSTVLHFLSRCAVYGRAYI